MVRGQTATGAFNGKIRSRLESPVEWMASARIEICLSPKKPARLCFSPGLFIPFSNGLPGRWILATSASNIDHAENPLVARSMLRNRSSGEMWLSLFAHDRFRHVLMLSPRLLLTNTTSTAASLRLLLELSFSGEQTVITPQANDLRRRCTKDLGSPRIGK